MADDSINILRQQNAQDLAKTTEQFSKKFKNVVSNLQEVNTPLAKTIADLRETTKGSFKAAANAKELQNYTQQIVKATSDNVDKTTTEYKKLSEGLDRLSGSTGFVDKLKLAQDTYSLNQLKAITLEQEIAEAEIKNRKKIQDYRDKIQQLEYDSIRAEGFGDEKKHKELLEEKKKQSASLLKFETEIYDTKREELEVQKNLMDKSKSNLDKLNETVEKQSKEIAEQDTKFTMFGQGLKELTGFDLLGTLDTVVDKVDAVGKIFGNKDLSGSIASAFSFGGEEGIAASIAGDTQEQDPAIKIARKELKETEEVNEGVQTTNKLLRTLVLGGALNNVKGGDENNKFGATLLTGRFAQLLAAVGAPAAGYLGFKGAQKSLETFRDGTKGTKGGKTQPGMLKRGLSGLKNIAGGRGKVFGAFAGLAAALGLGSLFGDNDTQEDNPMSPGSMGAELGSSSGSAIGRSMDSYRNTIPGGIRPDEIATEGAESYGMRGSFMTELDDFDASNAKQVDKLFNQNGKLDKRTNFYKKWAQKMEYAYGGTPYYDEMMNISPDKLDQWIDSPEATKLMQRINRFDAFSKSFTRGAFAKLPIAGAGLDVGFDMYDQNKYGKGIDSLESQGLLSGEDLKTVKGAESANKRGSIGRGIGSWAGGLLGAALPAAGALALGSNPVGWGILAASLLTGVGGAMIGGRTGDKIATFDSGAQTLTQELAMIDSSNASKEQKESMVLAALKKYKGIMNDGTPTEIVLKNASNTGVDSSPKLSDGNTSVNTNVVNNKNTTIQTGRHSFRNPDDTARLVDLKYS
jgi:hypothetical protein